MRHERVVTVLSVLASIAAGLCAALIRPFWLAILVFLVLMLGFGGVERISQRKSK